MGLLNTEFACVFSLQIMDWKEYFTKAGIEEELSKEYAKSFEENRYGFCDKDRAIFPTFFNFAIYKCFPLHFFRAIAAS